LPHTFIIDVADVGAKHFVNLILQGLSERLDGQATPVGLELQAQPELNVVVYGEVCRLHEGAMRRSWLRRTRDGVRLRLDQGEQCNLQIYRRGSLAAWKGRASWTKLMKSRRRLRRLLTVVPALVRSLDRTVAPLLIVIVIVLVIGDAVIGKGAPFTPTLSYGISLVSVPFSLVSTLLIYSFGKGLVQKRLAARGAGTRRFRLTTWRHGHLTVAGILAAGLGLSVAEIDIAVGATAPLLPVGDGLLTAATALAAIAWIVDWSKDTRAIEQHRFMSHIPLVAVVGLGHVGTRVVRRLVDRGVRVIAMDKAESCPGYRLAQHLGVPVLMQPADESTALAWLLHHDVSSIVTVTNSDIFNLEVALRTLAEAPRCHVVARLADAGLGSTFEFRTATVGDGAAATFAEMLEGRHTILTFPPESSARGYVLAEIRLEEGSRWPFKTIRDLESAYLGMHVLVKHSGRGATGSSFHWRPIGGRTEATFLDRSIKPPEALVVLARWMSWMRCTVQARCEGPSRTPR
jgi:Trk K+ transport system NAD-binding subunit